MFSFSEIVVFCKKQKISKNIDIFMFIPHYIYSLSTYFENCLLPRFVTQSTFSRPSSQRPSKAALRDKSWRETIFKIKAGRFDVSVFNVIYTNQLLHRLITGILPESMVTPYEYFFLILIF